MPESHVLPASAFKLPPLPWEAWRETKQTLHLYLQIIGKLRMTLTPRRNHWWHVPLYVSPVGLTTGTLFAPNDPLLSFQIDVDFVRSKVQLHSNRGGNQLVHFDCDSCKDFYDQTMAAVAAMGVDVAILPEPYELPFTQTRFDEDGQKRMFDAAAVARWFRALSWIDGVFQQFRGDFLGKTSPVHFFWHSFDLAVTRFSGRRNPQPIDKFANPRDAEAYSHEVISFGFWPGDDDKTPFPAFYSYTAPEPEGLADKPLSAGEWASVGSSHMAMLKYDDLRAASNPKRMLLDWLASAYRAGAEAADWPVEDFTLPPAFHFER